MQRKMTKTGVILVFIVVACTGFQPYDAKRAEEKAQVCVACHGPDGNSPVSAWPKIAGQHEKYTLQQLKAFKQGAQGPRENAAMLGMVAGLNEEEMALLAQYYAQQMMTSGTAQDKDIALGERLYRGGDRQKGIVACAACHGPRGLGNGQAGIPRVSGQYQAYTLAQLHAYKNKQRRTDQNGIMRDIAQRMTEAQMTAISNYIEGLH